MSLAILGCRPRTGPCRSGRRWSFRLDVIIYASSTLAEEFLDPVQDAELKKISLVTYLGQPTNSELCEGLRKKSLAALSAKPPLIRGGPNCPPDPISSGPINSRLREVADIAKQLPTHAPPPAALALCTRCHAGDSAPPIPFGDSCALADRLQAPLADDKNTTHLIDMIGRIDSGDMPQGTQISEAEKSELKEYLGSLKSCPSHR